MSWSGSSSRLAAHAHAKKKTTSTTACRTTETTERAHSCAQMSLRSEAKVGSPDHRVGSPPEEPLTPRSAAKMRAQRFASGRRRATTFAGVAAGGFLLYYCSSVIVSLFHYAEARVDRESPRHMFFFFLVTLPFHLGIPIPIVHQAWRCLQCWVRGNRRNQSALFERLDHVRAEMDAQLGALDRATAQRLQLRREVERVRERMTLKHRNSARAVA